MNSWGNVGNDWEQQINAYISNLMRPRNQVAEYQAGQAGSSQNPGAYYQQLAAQAAQTAAQDPMRMAQTALVGNQAATENAKAGYERERTQAAQLANWMNTSENTIKGPNYMGYNRPEIDFSFWGAKSGGHGGGGGRGGGGGVPEMSMAEEDAKREKALAESAMYNSMVSGGTYVGPGAGWGATYSSPSYDLSTSSSEPSSGSGSGGSW